jgi:hypothetical protein
MDAKIVEFKKPSEKKLEYCFTCPCGNQLFVLRPDAKLECGHCGDIQPRLIWGQFFDSITGQNPPDQVA